MFVRIGLIFRIVGGSVTTLIGLGGALHLVLNGHAEGGAILFAVATVFGAMTAFRWQLLRTELPHPPSDRDTWIPFDVRATGITAPDGTIWLPHWSDGRLVAITGPQRQPICTIEYGSGPSPTIGLRAPDGSPMGLLGTVTPGRTFALIDGSGRACAWLQGAGGSFELHSRGAGTGYAHLTVFSKRGTLAIDPGTPPWRTLLCTAYILSRGVTR